MKPNTENSSSLPFGRHGKIQIAKTIVRFSANVPFQGENFDILRTKLCTLHGFQNVTVEPDPEDVAINVSFDCKVEGYIRNAKGLLRSMRKKLQYAMGQSYKCSHCLDRGCPYCDKRREEKIVADARDLAAELASRHSFLAEENNNG
jgi:hypothetical protein